MTCRFGKAHIDFETGGVPLSTYGLTPTTASTCIYKHTTIFQPPHTNQQQIATNVVAADAEGRPRPPPSPGLNLIPQEILGKLRKDA